MKRFALCFLITILFANSVFADVSVYSENNKFGLKDGNNNITKPIYKKLIRLGESAWIIQDGTKFGLIDDSGNIIVKPIYNKAERVLGKLVKFSKGSKYGIFDEHGNIILPVEYSSIDLLYGGMFVTSKNYKFGITDLKGNVILENVFDDIYMPDFNTLVIVYNGKMVEIERKKQTPIELPESLQFLKDDSSLVSLGL